MNMLLVSLGLLVFLAGCSDGSDTRREAQPEKASIPSSTPLSSAQIVKKAPSRGELDRADRILAYHNDIQTILAKGTLADRIYASTRFYDATWRLPPRQKGARPSRLAPPKGLFDGDEAHDLTTALQGMDKALDTMLGHYAALEKYVLNPAIRDDGKQGKVLVRKINSAHEQYMKAQKSWLEIITNKARSSEQLLLSDHPLKRQISSAQQIFAKFREIALAIASGTPQKDLLENCRNSISRLVMEGGKPPFPAAPNLERLYRSFLQGVQEYERILSRATLEGMHGAQRREVNRAQEICRIRYNEFVKTLATDHGQ